VRVKVGFSKNQPRHEVSARRKKRNQTFRPSFMLTITFSHLNVKEEVPPVNFYPEPHFIIFRPGGLC
jgi:hypothetical protein